jgi:hypothetical protein
MPRVGPLLARRTKQHCIKNPFWRLAVHRADFGARLKKLANWLASISARLWRLAVQRADFGARLKSSRIGSHPLARVLKAGEEGHLEQPSRRSFQCSEGNSNYSS